jgi:hypothetical protein
MKEMRDANQTKTDYSQKQLDIEIKESREEIKSDEAEMKFSVDAFQVKMDVSIANRKNSRKILRLAKKRGRHIWNARRKPQWTWNLKRSQFAP